MKDLHLLGEPCHLKDLAEASIGATHMIVQDSQHPIVTEPIVKVDVVEDECCLGKQDAAYIILLLIIIGGT